MGTRHLTCVVVDGEMKVAQYGQWDGYPEGQGKTILDFLATADLELFRSRVRGLRELTQEEWDAAWAAVGVPAGSESVTFGQGDAFRKRTPWLSRDCGANVLQHIQAGDCLAVRLSRAFANDSLFCEYAYVIDLDRNTLEAYRGFQQEPHNAGRFASYAANEGGYYPVAKVAEWSLANLPTVEELGAAFEEDEAEQEA